MPKLSIKKLSDLGLVLMAGSAFTAAIMPGKNIKKTIVIPEGSFTLSSILNDYNFVFLSSDSVSCELDTNFHKTNGVCIVTATTDDGMDGIGSKTSELGVGVSASTSTFENPEGAISIQNRGGNNTSDS